MIQINNKLTPEGLGKQLARFWELSGEKILNIEKKYDGSAGSPVYTVKGNYTSRGWTEWTQGFQYGSAILNYEATGAKEFLEIGKNGTLRKMSGHLTHMGVHDHGFNNISSYGNLLRLMKDGFIDEDQWERKYYELALKVSGAVQASRWTTLDEGGFIYSFNGPHSLFIDTIRSVRILMISHLLGQELLGEDDLKTKLIDRAFDHIRTTAKYSVYYGEGRDQYDVPGRTAHECIFNIKNGGFRSPSSQQGYSGRTTWTRGLAWAILGFAEELEFVEQLHELELKNSEVKNDMLHIIIRAVKATCDFYIENTPADGIPYWDTGAPMLYKLKDYLTSPADPFNDFEPVDSSAAVIATHIYAAFIGTILVRKARSPGIDPSFHLPSA
jgi:hypothetical protein